MFGKERLEEGAMFGKERLEEGAMFGKERLEDGGMFGHPHATSHLSPVGHYNPYEPAQDFPSTSQVHYKTEPGHYKTEPTTPGVGGEYSYPSHPFTPSPSSSGCESPSTPPTSFNSFYPSLEATDRLAVPYPAPTPPTHAFA